MSKSRLRREVHGVLLLDKPLKITSNAALQRVKYLFAADKAGHTGSLDPLATGMLPLCFGEATKFSQYLLDADKIYSVTAKLGTKTTTGDSEGDIVQQHDVPLLTQPQLLSVLQKFVGNITQIPSMYSAIKHQGKPLYALARKGIVVDRKPREINIYKLELQQHTTDTFQIKVQCSKGTYIRTLVEDIGEALGCGAHVIELRRLGVGIYSQQQMVTMEQLDLAAQNIQSQGFTAIDTYLLPIDSAMMDWEEVRVSEAAAYYLHRGQPIILPNVPTSGQVRLALKSGEFLGIGEILSDGRIAPKRLVQRRNV